MSTVINLKKEKSGGSVVRIDRRTRWGNRFRIGRDGTRAEVIELYRQWLWRQIKNGRVDIADLAALQNQRLGCWCAPEPCHGDVLKSAAAWATGAIERVKQDWN